MEANEFYTQKKNISHPRWKQLKECRCSYEKAKKMGIEFADQQNKELMSDHARTLQLLSDAINGKIDFDKSTVKERLEKYIEANKGYISNDNQETQ